MKYIDTVNTLVINFCSGETEHYKDHKKNHVVVTRDCFRLYRCTYVKRHRLFK